MVAKYRSLVSDLDYSFRMDGGMGYKALTFCTVLILGQLGYSVYLLF